MTRHEADLLVQRIANLHYRDWNAVVMWESPGIYQVEVMHRPTRVRTVVHSEGEFWALRASRRKVGAR